MKILTTPLLRAGLRLSLTICCVAGAVPASAQLYTDWWTSPNLAFQGFNIEQQGRSMFMAWFTYDAAGDGMWLLMGGPMSGPASLDADIVRTTSGPALGAPFTSVQGGVVGHGTLTFTDPFNATLAWTVDGASGTLPLTRETFGAPVLSGTYDTTMTTTMIRTAGCDFTSNVPFSFSFAPTASTFDWTETSDTDGTTSKVTGPLVRQGRWLTMAGTFGGGQAPLVSGTATMSALPIDSAVYGMATLSAANVTCVAGQTLIGSQ
ncbi:MAG: hypothetical protein JSR18_05855 [Proteobacteria bacterium]|nr:hypothetical protein [Pseudomonadota bacterium]